MVKLAFPMASARALYDAAIGGVDEAQAAAPETWVPLYRCILDGGEATTCSSLPGCQDAPSNNAETSFWSEPVDTAALGDEEQPQCDLLLAVGSEQDVLAHVCTDPIRWRRGSEADDIAEDGAPPRKWPADGDGLSDLPVVDDELMLIER